MNNVFSEDAWEEYLYWQINDKTVLKKINELLKDIHRNGASQGIGKPEALKYRKVWSRRINHEHRLVYYLSENGDITIISCKGYYEN